MRVAFLHPTYWPEVRRSSERLVHDLAAGLARRGHRITVLTSHPGRRSVSDEDGVRVVRARRVPKVTPLHWYEDFLANVPASIWRLRRDGFDLAHAFFPADAWAAALTRRHLGGPPFVFSLHGTPIRRYLVDRRYRFEQLQFAAAEAERMTVLSEAAAGPTRRYLLREPTVLPGGIACEQFAVDAPRAEQPTLVYAGGLRDSRERPGGLTLFEAFGALRKRWPEARLVIVRPSDPHPPGDESERSRWPAGVVAVEASQTEALARTYASAWATVLPTVDEPFAPSLFESLASGTPVVAPRSGGCPEIIADPDTGRLFDPDDPDDLPRALEEVLRLGSRPETASACRSHARRFDLDRVLDRWEEIYASILEPGSR